MLSQKPPSQKQLSDLRAFLEHNTTQASTRSVVPDLALSNARCVCTHLLCAHTEAPHAAQRVTHGCSDHLHLHGDISFMHGAWSPFIITATGQRVLSPMPNSWRVPRAFLPMRHALCHCCVLKASANALCFATVSPHTRLRHVQRTMLQLQKVSTRPQQPLPYHSWGRFELPLIWDWLSSPCLRGSLSAAPCH